jgi:hypothetical protein
VRAPGISVGMNTKVTNKQTNRVTGLAALAILLTGLQQSYAPPPLITGDVPTADRGTFEWYVGGLYQESGSIERNLPFTELVYGLTDRWEITAETAFVSAGGHYGNGDTVLGTKYVVLTENQKRPGAALSFEVNLPTGNEDLGLGAGAPAYELRLRTQKTWGWFTPILNVGGILIEDPTIRGVKQERRDVYRASFAQEWQVAKQTKLSSEIYGRSEEEPGGECRLAAQIGFKHKVNDWLQLHGAVGKSLRSGNDGGPDLRAYLGVRINFDGPWKGE